MSIFQLALYAAVLLDDMVLHSMISVGAAKINDNEARVRMMLLAIMDAASEISMLYPISLKKTVQATDGIIAFADVCDSGAFTVNGITSDGAAVRYTTDSTGIRVSEDGDYTVLYSPEVFDVWFDENIEISPEVGFMTMLHLVARNYCLFSGRPEEAEIHDEMYVRALQRHKRKRSLRMPARRFL